MTVIIELNQPLEENIIQDFTPQEKIYSNITTTTS